MAERSSIWLSVALHLALLGACAWWFRHPLTTQIIAAGEGQAGGPQVIEVSTIDAGQLGLTQPRAVSFVGEEKSAANNELVETTPPKLEAAAEVLAPKRRPTPKLEEKSAKTDRPTTNQTEQLVAPKPLKGSSPNTNVEVGRSYGSPIPAMTSGVGVASGANLGAAGVPGGSEYGRRIQMILSRNYNPPSVGDTSNPQYVKILLRIARDGRITSVIGGRVAANAFKQRSASEPVNFAAESAVITSNPLPPFPNGFLLQTQEAVAEVWFRYPK